MADQSDVEAALVDLAAAALYPDGTTAAVSVTGTIYRVYRGWPSNAALESDLAAGLCHVSVAGMDATPAPLDQYPAAWEATIPPVPSLTVGQAGTAVTFAGNAAPGQLAGILADDDAFAYRTRLGDTPELVAASLAALVNTVRIATVTGATLNIMGTQRLSGRVAADRTAMMPIRRQRGAFRITCWCADPATRDATAGAVDAALAGTPFVTFKDGSAGRLHYSHSDVADDLSTLPLYRRALHYNVDYTTTFVQTQPAMLFGIFETNPVSGTPTLHLS